MKSFNYTIKDALGIHARPAGMIVMETKAFTSAITLSANGKSADLRSLMALMALGVKQGTEVTVTAEGPDEDAAIVKMEEFFKANL